MVFSSWRDIVEDVLVFISGQEVLIPEYKEEGSLEAKIKVIPDIIPAVVEEEEKKSNYVVSSPAYYHCSKQELNTPEVPGSEDIYFTALLKQWFTKSSAVVQQGMSYGISLILEGGDSSGKVFREFLNSVIYSARNLEQAPLSTFLSVSIFSPDYTQYHSLSAPAYRFS